MRNIAYGGTPEEKKAALEWLQKVADDTDGPNSNHAKLLLRLLNYYVEKLGDV